VKPGLCLFSARHVVLSAAQPLPQQGKKIKKRPKGMNNGMENKTHTRTHARIKNPAVSQQRSWGVFFSLIFFWRFIRRRAIGGWVSEWPGETETASVVYAVIFTPDSSVRCVVGFAAAAAPSPFFF